MLASEIKELTKGDYTEVELLQLNSPNVVSYHTDAIHSWYGDEDNVEIASHMIMDRETYNNTILANSSLNADDFMAEHDRILVMLVPYYTD